MGAAMGLAMEAGGSGARIQHLRPITISRSSPKSYLNKALKNQNLDNAPSRMKEKWTSDGYKYEVRIYEAESQYGKTGSIYRVSRQAQTRDSKGQGKGTEYLGSDGVWYNESILKPGKNGNNPNYNPGAAEKTHIQL